MTLLVADRRALREPGVLYPGRKPVGNVVVNWCNPVARALTMAFVPQTGFVDLLDGPLSVSGGASVSKGIATFDGVDDKASYARPMPVSKGVTIMCRFRRGGLAHQGLISDKDLANWGSDVGVNLNLRPPGMHFKVGTDDTYDNTSFGAVDTWYTITAVHKEGALTKVYDGKDELASYVGQATGTAYTASAINAQLGSYYDGNYLAGDIEYCYVWKRALFDAERLSVLEHPYGSGPNPLLITA